MILKTKLSGEIYNFKNVNEVLSKANEENFSETIAGIAAESTSERIAAKLVLSELSLEELRNNPVTSYEEDEVTRAIQDAVDLEAFNKIKNMTVGQLREFILSSRENEIVQIRNGLTSEMISAVTKLMSNLDLIYAAKKLTNKATCNTTIGEKGTLGSRLQANHASDDLDGIIASVMEGLSYGIGDAVISLTPARDTIDNISIILKRLDDFTAKYHIPTQSCIITHVTTQMKAIENGLPLDLMFQRISGSQSSNSFLGLTISMLDEAYDMMNEKKKSKGPNFMYFETGQVLKGDNCIDKLTMEARSYGLAKRYAPFLVNTVVGISDTETPNDAKQVTRAGLEYHFMGKLTGLPMGVDVCCSNYTKADHNNIENLALLLTCANCNFFMGLPCGDDVMLKYQSTSFHDIAALREITDKSPMKYFEKRMEELGIMSSGKLTEFAGDPSIFM